MATFIKTGFWEKRVNPPQGYKGELNLDLLIQQNSTGGSVMTGATLSTDGTSGLTPKPIAGQQDLFLRGDATWAAAGGGSVMTGATSITPGTSGLTPIPVAGQQDLFLRGDATWTTVPSAPLPVKLTSQTLLAASWALIGDYYTYSFSNVNVTTTCDVSVTPQNASYQTAYNANILPYVGVAAGVATFYSQFPPVDNMIVDIVITQTT